MTLFVDGAELSKPIADANMNGTKSLPKEKSRLLVEGHGWTTAYAQGFVDGEYHRRRGEPLGAYHTVGIDEYASGFRAGYFQRKNQPVARTPPARIPSKNGTGAD